MTSLLSLAWRKNRQSNHIVSNHIEHIAEREHVDDTRNIETNDPWGLGIATSTSTSESITPNKSEENDKMNSMISTRTYIEKSIPSTPEGLRPRKSIQKLRQELLGYQAPPLRYSLNDIQANRPSKMGHSTKLMSPAMTYPSALSSFPTSLKNIPSELDNERRSPQMTLHSSVLSHSIGDDHEDFYGDSYQDQAYHDYDIVSMAASSSASLCSGSLDYCNNQCSGRQLVAVSPDLKPGKAKTAVGALLAGTSVSEHGKVRLPHSPARAKKIQGSSHHSILPPRRWMDSEAMAEEDETIRDDLMDSYSRGMGDSNADTESSLHASPSSLRRGELTTWKERQFYSHQDTSFTRTILGREQEAYDFGPILTEAESQERSYPCESMDAPCVLALVNDSNGLNVSAISSSHHPRELSSLHSLADTMDDDLDEEDYDEINRYQPLINEMVPQEPLSDDKKLALFKAQNQRRMKESCLLLTIERLSHDLELLKEVSLSMGKSNKCPSPQNHLFLGLQESNRKMLKQEMGNLLHELTISGANSREFSVKGGNQDVEALAIKFCLSALEKSTPIQQKNCDAVLRPYWKSLPGLRSVLGLKEDPISPPTVRGGESSLFSLPSDSANANDDTPHTSNVSMATTITTVLSPDKYSKQWRHNLVHRGAFPQNEAIQIGLRQSLESVIRLLGRLEAACLLLQTVKEKQKTIDEIKCIYLDFLQLPVTDLKCISSFFDLVYDCPSQYASVVRTVSNDLDVDRDDSHEVPAQISDEMLRINIVQNEECGQNVECDLWTPTTEDMDSAAYIPLSDDNDYLQSGNTNDGIEDLRRTAGSFDLESVQEEREDAPSWDEDEDENEIVNQNGPQSIRNSRRPGMYKVRRFWRGRVLGSRQCRYGSAE